MLMVEHGKEQMPSFPAVDLSFLLSLLLSTVLLGWLEQQCCRPSDLLACTGSVCDPECLRTCWCTRRSCTAEVSVHFWGWGGLDGWPLQAVEDTYTVHIDYYQPTLSAYLIRTPWPGPGIGKLWCRADVLHNALCIGL